MAIDFHDEKNKNTYATRNVADEWKDNISDFVNVQNKVVADIGCGGGIYSRAWASLGAEKVIGIDFSEHMVKTAIDKSVDYSQLSFHQGSAEKTGLLSSSIDLVFERALIHHFKNYDQNFAEVYRVLKEDGLFLIQDRTIEDVLLPSSQHHLRGFFFECFPKLIDIEAKRRPTQQQVEEALQRNGFTLISSQSFGETRQVYQSIDSLTQEIIARTGRSILHELTDDEITILVNTIHTNLSDLPQIVEQDYWHIWIAKKS